MKDSIFSIRRHSRFLFPGLTLAAVAIPAVTHAELPELEEPSSGTGNGIIDTLQNYGFDMVMLVSLFVVSAILIGVAYHAYTVYSEIHTGRKTWGEFGLTVAIGAILLVVVIWLLNLATGVLES